MKYKMLLEDVEIVIIFCFLLIIFTVLVICGLVNKAYSNDYPKTSANINALEMNNGDLVCVAYPNIAGGFVSFFSRSIWSHTGTIWIDPKTNVRYVVEGAIYQHKKYRDFQKIPLETWLLFNRKSIISYKKYKGPPISSEYMEKVFDPFIKGCKLEGFNIFWARFLRQKPYYKYSFNSRYTCLEFTIILGQELGIYEKEHIYCSYLTKEIVNNGIKFRKGMSYSEPVQFALQCSDLVLLKQDIKNYQNFWKK